MNCPKCGATLFGEVEAGGAYTTPSIQCQACLSTWAVHYKDGKPSLDWDIKPAKWVGVVDSSSALPAEVKMEKDQMSKCFKCRQACSQPPGKHNIEINMELIDVHRTFVYDLCDDCMDQIIDWIEEKSRHKDGSL